MPPGLASTLLPPPALQPLLLDARWPHVAPLQSTEISRYNATLIASTSEASCLQCNCTADYATCARQVLCPPPQCYVGLCQSTSETLYCFNCGYLDGFTQCYAPPPPPPPPPVGTDAAPT